MNHVAYHTLFVSNEGRLVLELDFDERSDAVRESVAFQGDGFTTELLTLSHANLYESAPELPPDERIAY